MVFRKLRFINTTQLSFTLIGLIVAIAIICLISAGTTMAISQVSTQNTARMTSVKQVAQLIEPYGDSSYPLNLSRVELDNTVDQVTYTLGGSELQRTDNQGYISHIEYRDIIQ